MCWAKLKNNKLLIPVNFSLNVKTVHGVTERLMNEDTANNARLF